MRNVATATRSECGMTESHVYNAIVSLLDANGVAYRAVHHEPTHTSEESARARGEEVRVGGKALLVKTEDMFRLFVLSAALKLDSAAVRAATYFGDRMPMRTE